MTRPRIHTATEPIFHRFDRHPPSSQDCLDTLYEAFSPYRPNPNWCRQCFDPDVETDFLACRDLRQAPPERLSWIHHEHPDCSGGLETFLAFLPPTIERLTLEFDQDIFVAELMARFDLWRWSPAEQKALRDLFCRAATEWFGGRAPLPLRVTTSRPGHGFDRWVSGVLVQMLLLLRVDPLDLFAWLARTGGSRAYRVLLDLAVEDRLSEEPSYFVIDDEIDRRRTSPVSKLSTDWLVTP